MRSISLISRATTLVPVLLVAALTVGCVAAFHKTNPALPQVFPKIRALVLVPPTADVYRAGVGSALDETEGELVAEWSSTAQENVAAAVTRRLGADGRFVLIPGDQVLTASRQRELNEFFSGVGSARIGRREREELECMLKRPISEADQARGVDALLLVRFLGRTLPLAIDPSIAEAQAPRSAAERPGALVEPRNQS